GIGNVSRHTNLPSTLLADLAYKQGEDTDFFAKGDFSGTPFRTLPARKKPLIQIDSDYYAIDPCFIRDAGYRALLFNLLQRKPDYNKTFKERQKEMSEGAFPDILKEQLPGAKIYQEVYYKDPTTRQWSENDTLVIIDDVLFLVEAKAGAAATIASPELDFKRHSQAVKDLILKAYKQCERFFNYLASSEEVQLYNRVNGKYVECGRVRRSDYRVMVPIGLTVESFSPFSTICKELPQINPLLDEHAFISMSIDDLFVLKRFLPTSGAFTHYMEVRQAVAGIKGAHLFDEFEHLGAYILKNRFDQDIAEQKRKEKNSLVVWSDMSDAIDQSFEGEEWEKNPKPVQGFPDEVLRLLTALDTTQAPGWLTAESIIRNFGGEARENFAHIFGDLSKTLDEHPSRYFAFGGEGQPLFVWIQRSERRVKWEEIKNKASAAALSTKLPQIDGIFITVRSNQTIDEAHYFLAHSPSEHKTENSHIFDEAERMSIRTSELQQSKKDDVAVPRVKKKIGRNEPCPCGSGKKYKKCHGWN
ncbi:SEC-C metal-binding domain-containing protein, partial [Endozoicomonas sp. ONNA1]|uniref:SEC-C metal-binding domain-containing protein n=1 Tax=Endozoicomonas sp. ONNA1 TaxID=2828740 RepID=UPI002149269F